ncbi:hypothetical protein [uncultured Mucilaginibacter sp.]|uniref:hypothetical protein n=1 Tax=uncultured Mucilaginibacter sp. TaxID=797541 RepID=UPI0026054682|nr:hypothetical protein [uncultured Mucilaginibacter sp.]
MKSNYERVTNLNQNKKLILYVSTTITLLLTINEKYEIAKNNVFLLDYVPVIVALNLILIVTYLALDFRATYIYSKAERNRTLQYLDNSFDTNFAGKKLENYFTQDKLNPGFFKLSINCFENTFHTFNITREMQPLAYLKAGIVIIIFVFSAAVGDKGIVRSLIEAILPITLLQDAAKLSFFTSRLETLFENFKSFFTNIKNSDFDKREPEAMRYVIEYETTLAWASIPLDSNIFLSKRDQLTVDWEELKLEYNINKN